MIIMNQILKNPFLAVAIGDVDAESYFNNNGILMIAILLREMY